MLNPLDYAFIFFVLIISFWAYRRGFLLEVGDFICIFLSIFLAKKRPIHSVFVGFIVYFIVFHLSITIASRIVSYTPARFLDRLLGFLFGIVKGSFLLFLIILTLHITRSEKRYTLLEHSYIYQTFKHYIPWIENYLRKEYEKHRRGSGIKNLS